MIVLHPFSTPRAQDKVETWTFLSGIRRNRSVVDEVVDRLIDEPMDYLNFLKEYWGRDDLVILEDDEVPTVSDFFELVECPKLWCVFPYPISFYTRTTIKDWNGISSLGFVKFDLKAQEAVPVSEWYQPGKSWGLDRMIEEPMIRRIGAYHLHPTFIRHNHKPTLEQRITWRLRGH